MRKKTLLITLFILAFTLAFSCSKKSKNPTAPSENTIKIANNAINADKDSLTINSISDNSISYTFSGNAPTIEKGDVLVSGKDSGYLRKVTNVAIDGNKINVETEQAALTDIIEQGKVDTTFALNIGSEKTGKTIPQFSLAKGVSISGIGYDLNGFEIVNEEGFLVKITEGSINFIPTLDIGFDIKQFSLNEFHAYASGDLYFNFDVSITATQKTQYIKEKSIFVNPPQIILVQMIGEIPIVEVVTFDLLAGIEINGNSSGGITSGFDQQTKIKAGAEYSNEKWTPLWEKDAKFNSHNTAWSGVATVQAKGYVRPVVTVAFYGVAGPSIDIVPYLKFNGVIGGQYIWQYDIIGGVTSNLNFNILIIEDILPVNYSTELVSYEKVIDSKYKEYPVNDSGITFIYIPGGTFQMGDVEGVGNADEKPVHTVTLSGFEMSIYEITNAQYCAYLNYALARGDVTATRLNVNGTKGDYSGKKFIFLVGDYSINLEDRCWIKYVSGTFIVETGKENYPVAFVTWYGAKTFALYYGFDLPTEAEWEYACRGGRQDLFGTVDGLISDSKANCNMYPGHPVDVGSYPKNPYGLYDMTGNVWEWCHDWYGTYPSGSVNNPSGTPTGSYRVLRGGCWGSYLDICRSAFRGFNPPDDVVDKFYSIGFRVVRRASPQNY